MTGVSWLIPCGGARRQMKGLDATSGPIECDGGVTTGVEHLGGGNVPASSTRLHVLAITEWFHPEEEEEDAAGW